MEKRIIKFKVWDEGLNKMIKPFKYFFKADEILLQFTGLLDINGKEIYEGDIVGWAHADEGHERYKLVEYKNGYFAPFKSELYNYGSMNHQTCVVYGNIFQNPELVKKITPN